MVIFHSYVSLPEVIGIVCAFEYPATNGQYQRFAQEVPASEK